MKKFPQIVSALFATIAILQGSNRCFAQTIPDVVTVQAVDPIASESGDTATFEITRTGPTNNFLTVFCVMGGTAKNGLDYGSVSGNLTIGAGRLSTTVVIHPNQDALVEGTETVVFNLLPSGLTVNPGYVLGAQTNAVAYIFDDDGTNAPLVANIISPAGNSDFYAPTNIPIFAKTLSLQNSVTNVEFFAGALDLGAGNLLVLDPPGVNGVTGPVYYFNWTNAAVGNYSLTAVATDDGGNSVTSTPVAITMLPPPPLVKIVAPTNGSTFVAPVDIFLSAIASSSNADVVRVNFYADDHFIAADFGVNKAHYDLTWTNPAPGFYDLRAVAFDSFGGEGSSDVVGVTVTGTNTPPSVPVVTIRAMDPVAVIGTNCLGSYSNAAFATSLGFRPLTNAATFVVQRSGTTTGNLNVYYSISGTASNGVDYVPLPGVITIPAGKRAAAIVIYPLAENVVPCPESIVLSLTNGSASYAVGWPDRAAGIIVDCSMAPPSTALLCDGSFHFFLPPTANAPYYRIECSTDLTHWIPVSTNTASAIGIHFTDPQPPNLPSLFYRAMPEENPPADDL